MRLSVCPNSCSDFSALACELAQRACCARERNAQRFWGPLGAGKVLRARPMRATRVLRAIG